MSFKLAVQHPRRFDLIKNRTLSKLVEEIFFLRVKVLSGSATWFGHNR